MNLEAQKALLAQVERDITKSEARVARQALRIERLSQDRREVRRAEGLLSRLEMARQAGVVQRTEILRNIAELEAGTNEAAGGQSS